MKDFYIKTTSSVSSGWQRPEDWISIPSISPGSQVIYMVIAVTDQPSNHIAFLLQGAYSVDWGDGSTSTVASNIQAEYNYTYSSLSAGTEVTHNGVTFRQALITITPQVANNITVVNLQRTHSALLTAGTENYKVIDMVLNIPNITGANLTIGGSTTRYNFCERVYISEIGSITSAASLFLNFFSLESVPLFSTNSVTSMNSMFQSCSSIKEVPLFNTASCTSTSSMFASCASLETVPLFNFAALTSPSNMFTGCTSLKHVPAFDMADCVNISTMFNGCTSLQIVPPFNLTACTNVGNMFPSCNSLLSFEGSNMGSITTNTTWLNTTESLEELILTGFRLGSNITNGNMSATAIDALFTSLGTASGAQTITVTGNPGASTCTTSIATTKGYTVVT